MREIPARDLDLLPESGLDPGSLWGSAVVLNGFAVGRPGEPLPVVPRTALRSEQQIVGDFSSPTASELWASTVPTGARLELAGPQPLADARWASEHGSVAGEGREGTAAALATATAWTRKTGWTALATGSANPLGHDGVVAGRVYGYAGGGSVAARSWRSDGIGADWVSVAGDVEKSGYPIDGKLEAGADWSGSGATSVTSASARGELTWERRSLSAGLGTAVVHEQRGGAHRLQWAPGVQVRAESASIVGVVSAVAAPGVWSPVGQDVAPQQILGAEVELDSGRSTVWAAGQGIFGEDGPIPVATIGGLTAAGMLHARLDGSLSPRWSSATLGLTLNPAGEELPRGGVLLEWRDRTPAPPPGAYEPLPWTLEPHLDAGLRVIQRLDGEVDLEAIGYRRLRSGGPTAFELVLTAHG